MEPFRVHILGCGSALPTLRHNPSAQVVECRGKLFMVDCGEGAQMQLRRAQLGFNKVGRVFISHLHGDHCLGLVGMVCTFGMLGRTAPLHIHAHADLGPMLQAQLRLFSHDLGYEVAFHPLDTTARAVVYDDRSLQVETIPLSHRVPCCGFLFREKPQLPHIRRQAIDAYGIPLSQIPSIKAGQGYRLPDGTLVPHERLVSPAEPPRAYAYCSDTRYLPQLHRQLAGVGTIYHESTYGEADLALAEKYYHSTARQAALVASAAGARLLLLGHYSSRYADEQVLLGEARQVFPNTRLTSEMDVVDVV